MKNVLFNELRVMNLFMIVLQAVNGIYLHCVESNAGRKSYGELQLGDYNRVNESVVGYRNIHWDGEDCQITTRLVC